LRGEIPSASEEISGCPFHTRCPRFLGDICVEKTPPWQVDEKTGKRIFCHIPLNDLSASQQPPIAIRKSTTGQE
jgi:peptide/nickel transport system ATP-binding protein